MLPNSAQATATDNNPAYDRPRTSPGGAANPKYARRIVAPAKASSPVKGESASFPIHVGDGDPSASSLPPEVAASLAENQQMYGLGQPPIASSASPAAASLKQSAGTPATLPKPKSKPPAAEVVPDFLKNKDLFGLEPALSIRTRILLACHAQSRMNMSLDIAKSFAIAGYFPRQRCAYLPSAFFIMHLLYLQTSKAESISGRSGSSKWRAAARRKARFWSKT